MSAEEQNKPTQTNEMHQRLVSAIGYLDVCFSDISPLSTNGVLKTLLEAVEPLYRLPVAMTPEEEREQAEREQTIEGAAFDVLKAARAYVMAVDSPPSADRFHSVVDTYGNLRAAVQNFDEVAENYEGWS